MKTISPALLIFLFPLTAQGGAGRSREVVETAVQSTEGITHPELRSRLDQGGASMVGMSVRPGVGPVETRAYPGQCRAYLGTQVVTGGSTFLETFTAQQSVIASLGARELIRMEGQGGEQAQVRVQVTLDSTTQLVVADAENFQFCCQNNPNDCRQFVVAAQRGRGVIDVAVENDGAGGFRVKGVQSRLGGAGESSWHRVVAFQNNPVDYALQVGSAIAEGSPVIAAPQGPTNDCAAAAWTRGMLPEGKFIGISKAFSPDNEQAATKDALRDARLQAVAFLEGADEVEEYTEHGRSEGSGPIKPEREVTTDSSERFGGKVSGLLPRATCIERGGGTDPYVFEQPWIKAKVLLDIAGAQMVP